MLLAQLLVKVLPNPVRYSVRNGMFTLDTSWTPPAITDPGQEPGGSLIVMNDWILGAKQGLISLESGPVQKQKSP